jgi:hypothetical protein
MLRKEQERKSGADTVASARNLVLLCQKCPILLGKSVTNAHNNGRSRASGSSVDVALYSN